MATGAGDLLPGVAASLTPQAPVLSAALMQQIIREIPDLAADKPVMDLLAASVADNVVTALRVIEADLDIARLEAPAAALEYARRLAQRGVPISALLRAYRLGQAGFQQRMMEEIAAATADPKLLVAASLELSAIAFGFIDRISEQVVAAYQAERDRWMRNRVAVRSARVTSVLAAGPVDVAQAEKLLGYPLQQAHLGVVAWADGNPGPASTVLADPLTRLERLVTGLAEHFGCDRAPLFIAPDESTMWAWLPRPRVMPAAAGDDAVPAEDGTWIALGDPAPGLEGFRLTHRQARQAQVVALAAAPAQRCRVTASARTGVIGLMCADIEALRGWVHQALGDLAADDDASARLRETVWAFLSAGGSHTAAAQALMLHKNTVQYRIRKAELARGRPLQDGRLDAEVALLAARWLGPRVLQPGLGSQHK